MTDASAEADRNEAVTMMWDKRMRKALRPLISDELIAEHQRDPLGSHGDALKRVLNYFRRSAARDGKYIVVCTEPFRRWSIARLSGVRGQAPALTQDFFSSELEAMHALFLKRVDDLMQE